MRAAANEIELRSGRLVSIDPITPSNIDINDIAHALGNLCRFGGHAARFYSVAEHCVLMLEWFVDRHPDASIAERRAILLHDAQEAYLVDMPRPLKALMPDYRHYERELERAIAVRFQTHPIDALHEFDLGMLAMEKVAVMRSINEWPSIALATPCPLKPEFWSPYDAGAAFLAKARELQCD